MALTLSKASIESQLSNRFGDVFKLNERRFASVIPTGVTAVDALIGGLPRGAITEIFGPASSGRTSLLLAALGHATTHDEVCALIDTNNSFDPASAAKAQTDLDRLLWVRCDGKLEHAFKAADLLLQGGGFGLVVLDLGDLPAAQVRKIISSWWYRFRRVVEDKPTALVVIVADSCVRSCAALTLETGRESAAWVSVSEPANSSARRQIYSVARETQVNSAPTHSIILRGAGWILERLKPVHFGERTAHFESQAL
jgi:recombination protein RecA